jgi:spore maturation protein CgeB
LITDVAKAGSIRELMPQSEATGSFRILCIGETWLGSDARAAFAALRRLGHSVEVLDPNHYLPLQWQTFLGKTIRKIFRPVFVRELLVDASRIVTQYKPDCLFVWKGNWVHPSLIEYCRQRGVTTINYYPDVSFLSHGPYIPRSLPFYDHIFNTKSYGVRDMQMKLGIQRVSFLEPGYDPELHRPLFLTEEDLETYGCDVVFIGSWSPKKESILASLRRARPDITIKIWGNQWEKHHDESLISSIMGHGVTGDEYTKAICGSAICLGLLSEQGEGSSSGDLITARTFQIPACGTFMLHERNAEVIKYFEEGHEAEFFITPEELAEKVGHYLSADQERHAIAQNGLRRSLRDDYSIDNRMKAMVKSLINGRVKSVGASA